METAAAAAQQRPELLRPIALLLCVLNVAGVLFYQPMDDVPAAVSVVVFSVFYGLIAVVSFVVIGFFWRGRNWARWLVLATSVLALFNVQFIPSSHFAAQLLIGVEAVVAAWLLYWLNTEDVSRFFKRSNP